MKVTEERTLVFYYFIVSGLRSPANCTVIGCTNSTYPLIKWFDEICETLMSIKVVHVNHCFACSSFHVTTGTKFNNSQEPENQHGIQVTVCSIHFVDVNFLRLLHLTWFVKWKIDLVYVQWYVHQHLKTWIILLAITWIIYLFNRQ